MWAGLSGFEKLKHTLQRVVQHGFLYAHVGIRKQFDNVVGLGQ
jgi:hypothetical protein